MTTVWAGKVTGQWVQTEEGARTRYLGGKMEGHGYGLAVRKGESSDFKRHPQ